MVKPTPTASSLAATAFLASIRPKIKLAKKVNVIHDLEIGWLWDESGLLNLEAIRAAD